MLSTLRINQDYFIIILLALISLTVSYRYLATSNTHAIYYQSEFAPAVLKACGHAFTQPAKPNAPLKEFLDLKTNAFDCKNLPFPLETTSLDKYQQSEFYLIGSVSYLWKLFGIKWRNILPLFLLLYCITSIAVYGIFRLGMNKALAVLFTLAIIFSPLHLNFLPNLRDYSVGPFALTFIYLLSLLIIKPHFNNIYLSAFIGVVLGIGFGFRTDLLVFVPLFLLACLFLATHQTWLSRIMTCAIFLISFLIFALPILLATQSGNIAHVILLGLYDPFTDQLAMKSSIYSIGYFYNDIFPLLAVQSFALRIHHAYFINQFFDHHQFLIQAFFKGDALKSYAKYIHLYLFEYVKNFPADILERIKASLYNLLIISIYRDGALHQLFSGLARHYMILFSFISAALTLFILSAKKLRYGIYTALLIVYFAAYSVLQFDPRHYFYLEFINLWCIGFLIQSLISHKELQFNTRLSHILGFFSLLIVPFLGLLWLACSYQTSHLRGIFSAMLATSTSPVAFTRNGDTFKFQIVDKNNEFATTTLKIELKHCQATDLNFDFKYKAGESITLTQPVKATFTKELTLFYPIYNSPLYKFTEMKMTGLPKNCEIAINKMNDTKKYPFLLFLQAPEHWRHMTLYQSLKHFPWLH